MTCGKGDERTFGESWKNHRKLDLSPKILRFPLGTGTAKVVPLDQNQAYRTGIYQYIMVYLMRLYRLYDMFRLDP